MKAVTDPRAWLDLVKAEADELRAKGVLSIGFEGMTATFAPYVAPVPTGDVANDEVSEPRNPLYDAASYPHGEVPGFEITKYGVDD